MPPAPSHGTSPIGRRAALQRLRRGRDEAFLARQHFTISVPGNWSGQRTHSSASLDLHRSGTESIPLLALPRTHETCAPLRRSLNPTVQGLLQGLPRVKRSWEGRPQAFRDDGQVALPCLLALRHGSRCRWSHTHTPSQSALSIQTREEPTTPRRRRPSQTREGRALESGAPASGLFHTQAGSPLGAGTAVQDESQVSTCVRRDRRWLLGTAARGRAHDGLHCRRRKGFTAGQPLSCHSTSVRD